MHQKSGSDEPKRGIEKPVLVDGIDTTLRTIQYRTKLYRSLVAAVSIISIVSIVMAVLFHQWLILAGLIMLVPLTGGFLVFDSRLVRLWRVGIIEMARSRGLDVAVFLKSIASFRHLPPNSLKAMLSTLPASREENRHETPQPEHAIVRGNFDALDRKTELKILRSVSLLTIALICLVAGAFYGSLALLLSGGSSIILLAIFGRR